MAVRVPSSNLSRAERRRRYRLLMRQEREYLAARHYGSQTVLTILFSVAMVVGSMVWCGIVIHVTALWDFIGSPASGAGGGFLRLAALLLLSVLCLAPFVVGTCLSAKWITRTLAMREIGRTRCPGCRYSFPLLSCGISGW